MWRKSPDAKPSSESYNQPVSSVPSSQSSNPAAPPVRIPSQTPAVSPAPVTESPTSPASRTSSRITSGLKIHGEFSGTSDLYIDGEVQGKIRLAGSRVTVGPNGRVQAEIDAREIVINGAVQGSLKAGESAHFGATSRVTGTIVTPRIGVDDGAKLRGKVETVRTAPAKEPSAPARETDSEALQPVTTVAQE